MTARGWRSSNSVTMSPTRALVAGWRRNDSRVSNQGHASMKANDSSNLIVFRSFRKSAQMTILLVLGTLVMSALWLWAWRHTPSDTIPIMVFGGSAVFLALTSVCSLYDTMRNALSSRKDCLILTADGFTQWHRGKEVSHPWTTVRAIKISYETTKAGAQRYVHIVLGSDGPDMATVLGRSAGAAEPEIILDDIYEKNAEALFSLLKDWRRRARRRHREAIEPDEPDE